MKKMLFLSSELPYPPESGGRLKSWKMVEAFSHHYDLSVACVLKGNDADHVPDFRRAATLREFRGAEVDIPRSAANLLRSYREDKPLNLYRTWSGDFARWIEAAAPDYDIILVDHYEVFQYLPESFAGSVVLHTHNAEHVMWERSAALQRNPLKRWVCRLEASRIKRHEIAACRRAELVFAAPNDIERFVQLGLERTHFTETGHLGDDTLLERPCLEFGSTREQLLYFGTLNWEPNVDGLLWFLEQVWKPLKRARPGLRFSIAGRNPDPRLQQAAAALDSVELCGFVPDLEPLFRESRVLVSPLRFGSGMKVKVLTGMCRGLPIATTPVGAEGIRADDGRELAVAPDAGGMKKRIERLLDDPVYWARLRDASRRCAARHYTWDRLLQTMQQAIDLTMEQNLKKEAA